MDWCRLGPRPSSGKNCIKQEIAVNCEKNSWPLYELFSLSCTTVRNRSNKLQLYPFPSQICHQDPIIKNIGYDKNNHRCVDLKYLGSQKCVYSLIKDINNYLWISIIELWISINELWIFIIQLWIY